ncbi:MAG TPA: type II secretion system protein [Acidobacteriota bacterium]
MNLPAVTTASSSESRCACERGFTLVALIIALSIMSVMLALAVPLWDSVVRREHEEELIYRGEAIAAAIDCYSTKFPGVPLKDIKTLVEQKCLRREYKDPFNIEGEWRKLYTTLPPGAAALGSALQRPDLVFVEDIDPEQTPNARLVGVAGSEDQESFRIYQNATNYREWRFLARSYSQLATQVPGHGVPTGFAPPGDVPGGGQPGTQPPQQPPQGGSPFGTPNPGGAPNPGGTPPVGGTPFPFGNPQPADPNKPPAP